MATDLLMPALTPTMEVGTLSRWLVKPGDTVAAGQVIAEIETDKSVLEFEAIRDGVIGELRVLEGTEDVKVDTVIATLLDGDETPQSDITTAPDALVQPDETQDTSPRKDSVTLTPTPAAALRANGKVKASPAARRLARRAGIDLRILKGTGPGGRIVAEDVPTHGDQAGSSAAPLGKAVEHNNDYVDIKLSTAQRAMARRMVASKTTVPHLYLSVDIAMDALIHHRQANGKKGTINDFIVRGVALALRDTPKMNVQYHDGVVRQFRHADVAVAIGIDGALVAPILRAADTKPVETISEEIGDLAARAKDKRLSPEEYKGGTFTVSNVGMLGVDKSWPIVNPPHAGILGIGRATPKPIAEDGKIGVATMMSVTLAADHRCIDGIISAEFLDRLRRYLEKPETL